MTLREMRAPRGVATTPIPTSRRPWRSLGAAALLLAVLAVPAAAQCPAVQLCICTGDCDRSGEVDIVELQGCINGFLGAET